MNIFNKTLATSFALLWTFVPASAGPTEDAIVSKVVEAYGGHALTSAKSITIIDYNKAPWPGQGASPTQPDFFRNNAELTIDFEAKRKSMLSWRVSRSGKDLDLFLFDGNQGRIYDLLNQKYSDEDWLTYDTLGQSVAGSSDTILAHALWSKEGEIQFKGEANYRGLIHQKLEAKIGSRSAYTLYVDKASGLISKMVRDHPKAGEISHIFSNHQQTDGVTFAQDMNFFVGGQPRRISVERAIEINPSLDEKFGPLPSFTVWGKPNDITEMLVREVADRVYHVGKGRSFTVFIDAGDHFIGSGGQKGLQDNFRALQNHLDAQKPLGHFILTHHHSEHLNALKEAVALGAQIVTVSEHLETVQATIEENLPAKRFVMVDTKAQLADGLVNVFDISTAHSENYLLVHIPHARIIFGEDHFETPTQVGLPRVHKDMVNFKNVVVSLDIDEEKLLDGHSPRILTMQEFLMATAAHKDVKCPSGYRICAKG